MVIRLWRGCVPIRGFGFHRSSHILYVVHFAIRRPPMKFWNMFSTSSSTLPQSFRLYRDPPTVSVPGSHLGFCLVIFKTLIQGGLCLAKSSNFVPNSFCWILYDSCQNILRCLIWGERQVPNTQLQVPVSSRMGLHWGILPLIFLLDSNKAIPFEVPNEARHCVHEKTVIRPRRGCMPWYVVSVFISRFRILSTVDFAIRRTRMKFWNMFSTSSSTLPLTFRLPRNPTTVGVCLAHTLAFVWWLCNTPIEGGLCLAKSSNFVANYDCLILYGSCQNIFRCSIWGSFFVALICECNLWNALRYYYIIISLRLFPFLVNDFEPWLIAYLFRWI
jgi:hypothetical protein